MSADKETINALADNAVSTGETTDTQAVTDKYVGQVKWFNNKAGYGFITTTGSDGEKDIFAHYSTIQASNAQYKYLVLGEYVEFQMTKSVNESHEYQATSITGINGGRLMCETRQLNRAASTEDRPNRTKPRTPRGPPPPMRRKNDGEQAETSEDGFQEVNRGKNKRGPRPSKK
jgi:cold shock CspA family protein